MSLITPLAALRPGSAGDAGAGPGPGDAGGGPGARLTPFGRGYPGS